MIEKFRENIFRSSVVYLLVTFLLALTLNACAAQPAEVVPAKQNTATTTPIIAPTVTPERNTYHWNGTIFKLNAPFPETPTEMKVYLAKDEVPATVDSVRALAKQFKMNGEVYKLTGHTGITASMLGSDTEYLVVDGNRELRVRSNKYFLYIPDYVSWVSMSAVANPPDARSAIEEFMRAYGFTSGYKVEQAGPFTYAAFALSPDSFDVLNGNFHFDGLKFRFNQKGIAEAEASLSNYDKTATMGIISAEEAFQKFLDSNNTYGYIQGGRGQGVYKVGDKIMKPEDFKIWTRVRPLDVSLTYSGYLSSTDKSVDGGTPFIVLDGYTVAGKTSGVPANMHSTYIEARGRFHEANGVKTFEMEAWKEYEIYRERERIYGTLQREGAQFVLEEGTGKKYILQDVPADVPLPMYGALVRGVIRGGVFDWQTIDNRGPYHEESDRGVSSFYKINFSGTPVPFPTPIPSTPRSESIQKPVEGLRGTLLFKIFLLADGTQRINYGFIPYEGKYKGFYLTLTGNVDETLKAYDDRPIDVWGTMNEDYQIVVERYEIPYPDLQFQLISGSQKLVTVDGQEVSLIMADNGVTYIVVSTNGAPTPMKWAPTQDNVIYTYKALIVPDETLLGYPGMRVFNSAPKMANGIPPSFSIINDQPSVSYGLLPLPIFMPIEKIELAYFAPDQRYSSGLTSSPVYVQPVWRFYGHYEDGSEFEILVQALKEEFLLPEIQGW